MNNPTLYMMCGLVGSGKSSYAEQLAKTNDCIIHASDRIREELGDINDQSKNEYVFTTLHKRVKEDLRNGKNVIYDATNLNRRKRMAFLKELKDISCHKVCILMATPYEFCVAQNFKRERNVPVDVIWRMYLNFQMPSTHEGFDEVIVHYENDIWEGYYGDIIPHVLSLCEYDQNNTHHNLTLGRHMLKAGEYILSKNGKIYDELFYAAIAHDIGKEFTKSFYNKKGEMDTNAHYYNHQNCGAYDSLFYNYSLMVNKKYISLLIELHMRPYLEWKQSEKARQRDIGIFGEGVYNDVMMIHEADLFVH